MNQTPEEFLADACRVSILIDVTSPAAAAEEALERATAQGKPDLAEKALTRLTELLRRVAPEEALVRLGESGEPSGSRLRSRIHALLELGRFEEARRAAPKLGQTSPADQVVQARLAYLNDRALALKWLQGALENAEAAPETQAEALNLRGRWLAETGDYAAGAADFAAVMELSKTHGALGSLMLAHSFHTMYGKLSEEKGMGALDLAESIKKAVTRGVEIDPTKLGPIPAHVHGLLVRFNGKEPQPETYTKMLVEVASLLETGGHMQDAYVTLYYGAFLAERVFGPSFAATIRMSLEHLLQRVGPERGRELFDYAERRAAALLRLVRPQDV